MTSGVSGKKSSVLPRSATGRPCTLSRTAPLSICTLLSGSTLVPRITGRGWALKAASNVSPCSAVVLLTGSFRVNSPSSGMHSFLQTSQAALSLMSSSPDSRPGLNWGVMVSGTGSSTVFS